MNAKTIAAQHAALIQFARAVFVDWPNVALIDALDIQDAAVEAGLLQLVSPAPTIRCGESCECAEYLSPAGWAIGARCYRLAEWMREAQP